jgi:hypothetical protein
VFQQFYTYVASASSEYCKSRSNVATRDPPAIVACYSCWDDVQAGEVEGAQRVSGPCVGASGAGPASTRKTECRRGRPNARPSQRPDGSTADSQNKLANKKSEANFFL